ncbi:MAG: hypothetical protein JO141_02250 [Bradyrhizobium sp.]|nr:hypothetical protein [Bradyrhizobium sp.]
MRLGLERIKDIEAASEFGFFAQTILLGGGDVSEGWELRSRKVICPSSVNFQLLELLLTDEPSRTEFVMATIQLRRVSPLSVDPLHILLFQQTFPRQIH